MTSKHDETIATYLLISKANKTHGTTAKTIADACSIPVVSVYRILREPDNSFFQSLYPTRPAGYYFDEELMAETLHRKIDNSVAVMMTQQKAADLLKRAEKAFESLTPIGKKFSHLSLNDKSLETKLLTSLEDIETKYSWSDIIKALSASKTKDTKIATLLRAVHMIHNDLIEVESTGTTVPRKYAYDSSFGLDDDKYEGFLKHHSVNRSSLDDDTRILWLNRWKKATVID